MEDQIRALAGLQANIIFGNMVGGTQTVDQDQVNIVRMGNGENVHIIVNMADIQHIGGNQTNDFACQGESGPSNDPATDGPIFKTWTESKGDCYELKNSSCALIINNIFNGSRSGAEYTENYREGAQGDTEKLSSLFQDLKFSYIQTKKNVTSDRLGDILENFRRDMKEGGYSSCFIIIMSHGGSGANSILMDDLKDVDLYNDIVYKFSAHEDVRELPKVFLVQACRDSGGPPVCNHLEIPKDLQNVLIGHSTSPLLTAARDTESGAVYIDVIDSVFRESAKTSSLTSLLYEVYKHASLKELQQYPVVELIGFRDYRFKL